MSKNAPLILGINGAYHETAAALIDDGCIVAAVEEERLTGIKHGKPVRVDNAHELPWCAMEACLKLGGIDWEDLDAVAYSFNPDLRRKFKYIVPDGSPNDFGHPQGEATFLAGVEKACSAIEKKTGAKPHLIEHHLAHAWYGMGTSDFDKAAVLILDGIGEKYSGSMGKATRNKIEFIQRDPFPNSVGLAWEKVACFLGMSRYDACKVMALAGCIDKDPGPPLNLEQALRFSDGQLHVDQQLFKLEHPDDYSDLRQWHGNNSEPCRTIAVSQALQRATEKLLLAIGQHLHEETGLQDLVYGGGVALNCRANAELAKNGKFSRIHIGPASHDAGTALGAAWCVHAEILGKEVPKQDPTKCMFNGPKPKKSSSTEIEDPSEINLSADALHQAAKLLVKGELLGWVSGPCEFGPRALGGRSLLAYPKSAGIVDRLNRIKGRRLYEPFAISVIAEQADEIFEIPKSGRTLADFMLMTVRPRKAWPEPWKEVVHKDGTVRLQIVHKDRQPTFHALLHQLGQSNAWPMVINTSLNLRGQPMAAELSVDSLVFTQLGLNWVCIDGKLLIEVKSNTNHSIPLGNTIAVVGDPGTGKTSLLLTFVQSGRVTIKGVKLESHSNGTSKKSSSQLRAFENFNKLFRNNATNGNSPEDAGTVRCFISLENGFDRLKKTHSELLKNNGGADGDLFVLIDASSLLSGRLEDTLRYPNLTGQKETQNSIDLHLETNDGGDDNANGYLSWIPIDKQKSKRIGDEKVEWSTFIGCDDVDKLLVVRLITPPVPDVMRRIRFLKDILASLFSENKGKSRLLAIDSLSALMTPFGDGNGVSRVAADQRLNLLNLVRWLEELNVTTMMAAEARRDKAGTVSGHPLFLGTEERYLASGIIQLDYHRYGNGELVRYLQVLKMRGAAHDMRAHAYDLSIDGLAWLEPMFGKIKGE